MVRAHPASYGETFAPIYDAWYTAISDVDGTVAALGRLTGSGRVLELGIGTGRLAIPLVNAGIAVTGVDASNSMLRLCAAKQPGPGLSLVQADMAALPLQGHFDLIFVAFNTLFNLTTPGSQQACATDVARLLGQDGRFVIEAFVPSEEPTQRSYDESSRSDDAGGRVLTTSLRNPWDQTVSGVHIHHPKEGPVARFPWSIRYLHLPQIDALCAAAGLSLANRWSTWDRDPFQPESGRHISVYQSGG